MKNAGAKKTKTAGFTMTEVLAALGILALLLAIAIPGVAAIRASLRQTERDNAARELYIVAQNRLTALRAAGELDALTATGEMAKPEDFPEGQDWAAGEYVYLAGDAARELLPAGAIDETLRAGTYIIEYNAATAAAYGVFYTDEPGALDDYPTLPRGDKQARQAAALGYYGGGTAALGAPEAMDAPVFRVVNGETLYIDIEDAPSAYAAYTVTIAQADGGGQAAALAFRGTDMVGVATDKRMSYADGHYIILLDSLETGKQFKDLYPGLTPGADLVVTVEVSDALEGGARLPASASARVNSLFASRAGATVKVENARQLQNLSAAFSGVEAGVTAAVQTGAVAWDAARDFQPIENGSLLSYDGGGQAITGLRVAAAGDAGLFAALENAALKDIRLEDAVVSGVGSAGALAGRLVGCTVSGCRAYGADSAVSGGSFAGGLVGEAEGCAFTGCFAALSAVSAAEGTGTAGGLAGRLAGGSLTGCYADTGVRGGEGWTGGLSALRAGGLVGEAAGGATATRCYALGWLGTYRTAGGLAAAAEAARAFTDCYSGMEYGLTEDKYTRYGLAPNDAAAGCAYLSGAGLSGGLSYQALRALFSNDESWLRLGTAATHPYGGEGAFPFPALSGLPHYGDWPAARQDAVLLAYWEKYEDGGYGFHAADALGEIVNTLREGFGFAAVADGYALLAPSGGGSLSVGYTGKTAALAADVAMALTLDGQGYAVYPLGTMETTAERNSLYHKLTCGDESFWYIPGFACAAVNGASVTPAAPAALYIRSARHLRSLCADKALWSLAFRQELDVDFAAYETAYTLSPIGNASSSFLGSYDGGGHTITGAGIEAAGSSHVGLFGYVGANTTAKKIGALSNIIFIGDGEARAISGASYVGALVGYNEGTIQNCAVAGFDVSGENYVGGLVGQNDGSIDACAAANAGFGEGGSGGSVAATGSYSSWAYGYLGGFAGMNTGEISSSYAVASITGTDRYIYRGGFVGANNTLSWNWLLTLFQWIFGWQFDAGSISDCYCAALAGDAWLPFRGDGGSTDCLALDGGNYAALAAFSGDSFARADAAHSYPYDPALAGAAYIFPAVVTRDGAPVHYGDWPTYDMENVFLAYYEVYEGGALGFYGQYEGLALDSLRNDAAVIQDGYALLFRTDGSGGGHSTTSGGVKLTELAGTVSVASGGAAATLRDAGDFGFAVSYGGKTLGASNGQNSVITVSGSEYLPLFLDAASVVNAAATAEPSRSLTVSDGIGGGRGFLYSPHFAKSARLAGAAADEAVVIRTERHFAALSANAAYWGLRCRQERDLDFGAKTNPYVKSYFGTALADARRKASASFGTSESAAFTGVYDGGGHSVKNLSLSASGTQSGLGLFRYTNGATVQNLKLEGFSLLANRTDANGARQMGALIGWAKNTTVENVTVTGCTVRANNLAGAAVGRMNGGSVDGLTVSGCTVEAARAAGGAFGQLLNEGGALSVAGVSVTGGTAVATLPDTVSGLTATNLYNGFGTGGLAGNVYLQGSADVSLSGVAIGEATVTVGAMATAANTVAPHHAGGLLLGALYAPGSCAVTLEGILLDGTLKADGDAVGDTSWYGLLLGRAQGAATLSVGKVTVANGAHFSLTNNENGKGTSLGGYVGGLYDALDLRLTAASYAGVTLPGKALGGTALGGFAGCVGAGASVSGAPEGGTALLAPVVKGDGGYTGGFAGLCAGSVSQLSVQDPKVGVQAGSQGDVGGFAGRLTGAAEGCDVRGGAVQGTDSGSTARVGGFAGALSGTARRCFAAVNVKQGGSLGGFAGETEDAVISLCYASGNVTGGGEAHDLGGFAGGGHRTTFESCYASGDVKGGAGTRHAGGFIGQLDGGAVLSCYSVGAVSAVSGAAQGGFVGEATLDSAAFPTETQQKQITDFYALIQEVKVVNREDPGFHADRDPVTGELLDTGCGTVWDYLKYRHSINKTISVDSGVLAAAMAQGAPEDYPAITGVWNDAGKITGYGAVTYNLYAPLSAYDQANDYPDKLAGSVWRLVWDSEKGEAVIYWTADTLTASGQQVTVYRYSKSLGFSVGGCRVTGNKQYGLDYYVLDGGSFTAQYVLPLAVYLYAPGGQNDGYLDHVSYLGSIGRWTAADFASSAATTFPQMRADPNSGYAWPMLPGVGCGVGGDEYRHFGA